MFGRDLPYLRAVPSRDSDVHRWVYRISTDNLGAALRRAGYSVGNIQRVWVHRFSDEGRAEEVKIVHSTGVLLLGGADVRNALGPGNIQSTYFTVEGQDTPEIPDEIPDSIYDFGSTGISLEKYALVNSCVLVPFPKPVQLSCCRVISGRGLSDGTSLAALGADGITRYTSGYIWVSEPERAGELGGALPQPQVDPGGFPFFPAEGTQVVEDPGSNVGTPVDGAFVFVGTGMGHGVGMSQHGARLLAQSGWTYTQILRYFYTGIEIVSSW
jgi:stage II sporulation protein D